LRAYVTKKDKTVIEGKTAFSSKARATGSRRPLRLRSILERSGEVEVAVEVEASVLEGKAVVKVETSVLEINAAVEVKTSVLEIKAVVEVNVENRSCEE
jgi:hypothetical protein